MSTGKHQLICFLGRNGAGKTYQANLLVQQGYVKISMADAMRELLWKILNYCPQTAAEYDLFKQSYFTLKSQTVSAENLQIAITGRQLLQNIGQACKDLFGEDFWIKAWEQKCLQVLETKQEEAKIVVDDIRFQVEIRKAQELGAKFIWCDYRNGQYPPDPHPSEALANKILASRKYKHLESISYEALQTFCAEL